MDDVTFSNPNHPIPAEVGRELDLYHQAEMDATYRQFELAKLARPIEDERARRENFYRSVGRSLGVDVDEYRENVVERRRSRLKRMQDHDLSRRQPPWYRGPIDFEPPSPVITDPSFWAADFNMWFTLPFGGEGQDDGLHFRGRQTYEGGSLTFSNFGAKSRYELHANRIPPSSTGRWTSDPHVELFGGLLGYVGEGDIFSGDLWSKCWMIRRQSLFQFAPPPAASGNRRVIGERVDVQELIFIAEGNIGDSVMHSVALPGFQAMPSVVLDSSVISSEASIWAELEVRFDIQLEGNSFLWIDPDDILLRYFQWPLVSQA
ncbi:hypothetical protein [Streptomyces sp. NPDC005148]